MKRFKSIFRKLDFLSDLHLVGGCIRDELIGRSSQDIDLATSDRPDEIIMKAGEHGLKTVPTGIDFGTVSVFIDGKEYEVTTFRKELSTDGRFPEVKFTDEIEEDLARRDFTINSIALNNQFELVDPFGGEKDIQKNLIQTVGDPEERFREDFLRIIRGCRFASRYSFDIEGKTWAAMNKLADQVYDSVSIERFYMELKKAFKDDNPSHFISLMEDFKLNKAPDIDKNAINQVSPDLRILVYFLEVDDIQDKADKLKLPNNLVDKVRKTQELLEFVTENPVTKIQRRKFQHKAGKFIDDFKTIAKALDKINWNKVKLFFKEIDIPVDPIISGSDLLDKGLEQGPEIGEKIEKAHQIQLEQGVTNKQELLKKVI